MKGRVSPEAITTIREQIDLLALVGEHVSLKRSGTSHKGLCPFHDEKTPSFHVSPDRGTWHCFGCNSGGDAIDFMQQIEGEGFRWAVEYLADRAGVTLEFTDDDEPVNQEREQRARLYAVNEAAADFFTTCLLNDDEAKRARDDLENRGIPHVEAAAIYGAGYAPRSEHALIKDLIAHGFTPAEITEAGLAHSNGRGGLRPRFQGRLTWTIRNTFSRAIGFGARRLSEKDPIEAKFINTSETPVYKKSEVLYGFDLARRNIAKTHHAVVVEGYTDVVACHLAGIDNAVAACGTAYTEKHQATLRRIVGPDGEITFGMDDDAAGRKATLGVYDLARGSVGRLTALSPSDGLDPDEYRQRHGEQGLRDLLDERVPLLRSVIEGTVNSLPLATPEDRLAALNRALPLIAHAPDALLRREYGQMLAGLLDFPATEVLTRLSDLPPDEEAPPPPADTGRTESLNPEREIVSLMVWHQDVAQALLDDIRWDLHSATSHTIALAVEEALAQQVNPETWGPTVLDHCEGAAQDAVSGILVQRSTAPPGRTVEYAREVHGRLRDRAAAKERDKARQVLATSTDPEERARAFQALTATQGAT